MPDELETILRLVAEGHLDPVEAAGIIAALDARDRTGARPRGGGARDASGGEDGGSSSGTLAGAPHSLRIQVTENDRRVVDLRVPIPLATIAAARLPGLSAATLERVRSAIERGLTGPVVDVADEEGRVQIVVE